MPAAFPPSAASAGNNHFNARYKNYLNWLTASDGGVYQAATRTVAKFLESDKDPCAAIKHIGPAAPGNRIVAVPAA